MAGTSKRVGLVSALLLVAMVAVAPPAQAVGELTPAGCITDNDTLAGECNLAANGLTSANSVAVSPDGKSVYVTSFSVGSPGDDAVVRFNRTSTGALVPAGCVDDNDTGLDVCGLSVNGLGDARGVAVSPDGLSVYVTSQGDDAIVRFNRSATGALSSAGCVDDNDTGADACAQSVNGLDGAHAVAVSPDGLSVYVVSSDDAVVRFNRSPTGALTSAGCVDDNDTGADACAVSVNGLGNASEVAVSPDGKSVYVTGSDDDTIVRFNRSPTGALTPAGCVNDNDTFADVCALSVSGLEGTLGVTVSSDGLSVYATSGIDDAIVRFDRTATGALVPAGCIDDNDEGPDSCARAVNGLEAAVGVAVSPDGESVYVVSAFDSAIVRFTRTATGALNGGDCIVDDEDLSPDACAQTATGLAFPISVAVSPDGISVYATGALDTAIQIFNRQP